MARNCYKHIHVLLDFEGNCPECLAALCRETPELAPMIRRSQRWNIAYSVWLVFCAGLVFAAVTAFRIYREWVIWTR